MFTIKVLKCGETLWRYSTRGCKSHVFTVAVEYLISRYVGLHTHEVDIKKLNHHILVMLVKEKL